MRSSRQIEQDIERTRSEMDETLEQFRERMKPRHLVDEAIGMFQSYVSSGNGNGNGESSGVGQHLAHGAKDAATHVSHALFDTVKRHPLPSLLIGAGAAWLVYEATSQNREWPDYKHLGQNSPPNFGDQGPMRSYDGGAGRSYASQSMGRDEAFYYGGPSSGAQRSPFATQPMATQTEPEIYAAWHEDYDWTDEDERAWSQNAYSSIAEIETTLSDENRPARERMRSVAGHLKNLSGSKYQSKWRQWKERSGSVVDARTGEPYTDDYGMSEAEGLDYLCEMQGDDESSEQHAQGMIARMRDAMSKGGRSVRRRLSDLASHTADYAGTVSGRGYRGAKHAMRRAGSGVSSAGRQTGEYLADAGRQTGHAVADAGRWVGHGAYEGARMTQQGAMSAGRTVRRSAVATTRSAGQAMDEYPLAAAGAFLGLGLLVGLLVPETEQEDRLMGETSDRMKRQAYEAGKDAAQRAGHVAKETVRAASEEAERQGIAPSQIADQASRAAQKASQSVAEVAGAAKETAPAASSTIADKLEQVAKAAAQTATSQIKEEARQSKAAHLMSDKPNA